jgi:hypothetical protein
MLSPGLDVVTRLGCCHQAWMLSQMLSQLIWLGQRENEPYTQPGLTILI